MMLLLQHLDKDDHFCTCLIAQRETLNGLVTDTARLCNSQVLTSHIIGSHSKSLHYHPHIGLPQSAFCAGYALYKIYLPIPGLAVSLNSSPSSFSHVGKYRNNYCKCFNVWPASPSMSVPCYNPETTVIHPDSGTKKIIQQRPAPPFVGPRSFADQPHRR